MPPPQPIEPGWMDRVLGWMVDHGPLVMAFLVLVVAYRLFRLIRRS